MPSTVPMSTWMWPVAAEGLDLLDDGLGGAGRGGVVDDDCNPRAQRRRDHTAKAVLPPVTMQTGPVATAPEEAA